jgi:hypothetical protein
MGANNAIGGIGPFAFNTISGNTNIGVNVATGATGTLIQGNLIGLAQSGIDPLPNGGAGVFLDGSGTTVGGPAGADNVIANNGGPGVRVNSGTGHSILGNSIFSNGGLGIDLGAAGVTANDAGDGDSGVNNQQNFPVLTAVVGGVQGTLNSTAGAAFTVQFFGNTACDPSGNGEGQTLLGAASVTTDANGNAAIPVFAAVAGRIVTATATNTSTNDTSEFSSCVTVPSGPVTFTVTNTNDSGAGSLRQAILDANARTGTFDTIAFNIPGAAPHSIAPTSPLPVINDPVTIDGTTQPGYAGAPVVELDGTSASGGANGLWLLTDGSVIRGLVINRFGTNGAAGGAGGAGIVLQGRNNVVYGNYIGTDVTGTQPRPNRMDGIWIDSSGNRIGWVGRNVISGNGRYGIVLSSGNASGTTIQQNYIGVDATGMIAVPNAGGGIVVESASNSIGDGAVLSSGNVISGNLGSGVVLSGAGATNNNVDANLIGVNRLGTAVVGNQVDGVQISGGRNNRVGGTTAATPNVIGGNGRAGVFIDGNGSTGNVVIGNFIGTNSGGTLDLGNVVDGITINNAPNTTIGGTQAGAGNLIAGNDRNGVTVQGTFAVGVGILNNRIHSNAALGIDLAANGVTPNDAGDADTGANNLQNFPVLTGVAGGVEGTLNSTANSSFTIQFFGNAACDPSGNGEGQTLLGQTTVTANAGGTASIPMFAASAGQIVTATATNTSTGDTSEFSACVTAASSNRAPTANAGPDQGVLAGAVVQLDGGGSTDPDGNPLTYAWTLTRPAGSGTSLSSTTSAAPTFVADVPGIYTARLIVNDGLLDSTSDDVVIDAAAPRMGGLIGSYFGGTSVLDGSGLPLIPATSPTFVRADASLQFGISTSFNYRPCLLTNGGCLNASYTVRWVGRMDLLAGSYTFGLNSSDAALLMIGGASVVTNPGRHAAALAQGTFVSPAAGSYQIEVRFTTAGTTPGIDLLYQPPGGGSLTAVPAALLWSDGTFFDTAAASAWNAVSFVNPAATPSPGGVAPIDSASAIVSFLNPAPVPEPGGVAPVNASMATVSFLSPVAVPEPGGLAPIDATGAAVSFLSPAPVPEPGGPAPVSAVNASASYSNPAPVPEPGGTSPVAASGSSVGYAAGPVVTGLAPLQLSRSAGGGQLVLTGSNLQNATAVLFDGAVGISASAPSVSQDGRTVTVTVTITGAAATGLVVVTVSTPAGTSAATAASVLEIVQ